MSTSKTVSLITGIVGLLIVALVTLPASWRIWQRLSPRKQSYYEELPDLYEDEDGTATKEAAAAFSDKFHKVSVVVLSILGGLLALALAVFASLAPGKSLSIEKWLQFASWIFLSIQAVCLFLEPQSTKRFTLAIYGVISSFILAIALCLENGLLWSRKSTSGPFIIHIILTSLQLAAAVFSCIAYSTLPRRPNVLRNGKVVDQQYTVSLFGRYAFSWPTPLLDYALKNKGLEIEDLPELDYVTRAKSLRQSFDNVGKTRKLWQAVLFAHAPAFILQNSLVVIISFTNFLPQIALLKILETLEAHQEGASVAAVAWLWVLGLGVFMVISSWVESWMFWIMFSRLGIPVYEQLSAVVFAKSMRRKDVKGATKIRTENVPEENGAPLVDESSGPKGDHTIPQSEEEEEDAQKTRQSTINLVGVDSKRVADFTAYNYLFQGTTIKLAVALIFLLKLIGWKSLLSGLVVAAVITPLNVLSANRYSYAQVDLMKVRDQKMAVVTEALQGIRQIKFSALEDQWSKKIGGKRETELGTLRRVYIWDTALITVWILGPIMLSAVSLAVYALINGELSASVAFTTISVFGSIELTLAIIPEFITEFLDAWVSAERIEKYLNAPEKLVNTVAADEISYEGASIAWPADEPDEEDRFVLRDISLSFPLKELSVISGKTGSGKSLLLSSLLGESDVLDGTIKVPKAPSLCDRFDSKATRRNWIIDSAIAFVAQIPWIENASIKDNILFGLPYDTQRYKKVLHACELEKDLEILPDGELTDIGANGINLSGGQRWRVSFARALYSRAGILVLDDIFSAVDANVGRHLYEEALTGELGRGRTRILVTHHVALCLPRTKYSVLLGEGTVQHAGLVEELRKSGSLTAILQQDHELQSQEQQKDENLLTVDDGLSLEKMLTARSNRSRRKSSIGDGETDAKHKAQPRKFTEDEKRETGAIKYAIYKEYIQTSGGLLFWAVIMIACAAYIGLALGRSWWVNLWTRSYHTKASRYFFHPGSIQRPLSTIRSSSDDDLWYYLGIYVGLSVLTCIIGSLRYGLVFIGSLRASRKLFEKLTYAVLRAPLRWLDTVPVGRVLNRFTADFNMIDSRISYDLAFMIYNVLEVFGIIVAGLFVSPFMILFAVVLFVISLYYALRFLAGAREVKRLESNAKSPVFEFFGSSLTGVGTVRAFDKADEYVERMYAKIDKHCRAYWHLWLFNRWMGFRLNMVGAVFATVTVALIVSIRTIDASLAGFALGFALQYTAALMWALRQYANVELDMNATERVVEFSNIPVEDQSGAPAPAAWPAEGRLEVADLVVGYAPDLPPVLRGLSFSIKKNQRVGVVGRTGAGKSSLTLALFRFLEAREGIILIDGIDISTIKLHDLRSRLAIIPQDPVLFSGTVRSNLDAFDNHSDAELRDALERVHLIPSTRNTSAEPSGSTTPIDHPDTNTNTNIFTSLSSRISEGGLNLSQGQRQLLCLGRAIVSRPKIMVLDEATSAVDMATDTLIQRSIREEFQDSTLIVIAHRLSTIADFDRILVMGEGRGLEFGTPEELYEKERGEFKGMVGESGEREELEEIILGPWRMRNRV